MLLHPQSNKPLEWVFFDLDNTLWDFDANAREALKVLFEKHQLQLHTGYQTEQFIQLYQDVNAAYWKRYEKGEVSKEVLRTARFTDTFQKMGLPPALYPTNVWEEYLDICPLMTVLIPNALETLAFLKQYVNIGILTNGFEATQRTKLRASNIDLYTDYVQSSEAFGHAKPSLEFFEAAINAAQTTVDRCIYIGDNQDTDVLGGMNAGILTYRFMYSQENTRKEIVSNPLFGGEVTHLLPWAKTLSV